MHVIRRRGWEIPARLATPESLFFQPPAPSWRGTRHGRAGIVAASGTRRSPSAPSDLPDPTQGTSIRSSVTTNSRSTGR